MTILSSAEAVSTWLYTTRASRGISQEALALKAGVGVPAYGRIERAGLSGHMNRITLDTFLRLVAALEPDSQELVTLLASLKLTDQKAREALRSVV